MTPMARVAAWLVAGPSVRKCGYCGTTDASDTSLLVGREWFCTVEHADEQQLFWSAI